MLLVTESHVDTCAPVTSRSSSLWFTVSGGLVTLQSVKVILSNKLSTCHSAWGPLVHSSVPTHGFPRAAGILSSPIENNVMLRLPPSQDLESPKRQTSRMSLKELRDWVNWGGMSRPIRGSTFPQAGVPDWLRKVSRAYHALCLQRQCDQLSQVPATMPSLPRQYSPS